MAAMHWGNCQICGREHKVSGVLIAKHGYTMRHGWQEGACYGSGGKPIQISCDLIQGAMDAAKRYIEQTKEEIAQLAANPLFDGGTVKMMIHTTTRTGSITTVEKVTVELNSEHGPVARNASGKILKTWPFYSSIKTAEAAAEELGNMRIGYLESTIKEANANIVYLADVLKNWKPTELRAISAVDTVKPSKVDALQAKNAAIKEKNRLYKIAGLERDIKEHQKWIKTEADPMMQLHYTENIVRLTDRLNEIKEGEQQREAMEHAADYPDKKGSESFPDGENEDNRESGEV